MFWIHSSPQPIPTVPGGILCHQPAEEEKTQVVHVTDRRKMGQERKKGFYKNGWTTPNRPILETCAVIIVHIFHVLVSKICRCVCKLSTSPFPIYTDMLIAVNQALSHTTPQRDHEWFWRGKTVPQYRMDVFPWQAQILFLWEEKCAFRWPSSKFFSEEIHQLNRS